jgi:hypothetical protein
MSVSQEESPSFRSGRMSMLCKSKDHLVAQYALSDVNKPIGVSAYELGKMLPSVEQLENELNDFGGDND